MCSACAGTGLLALNYAMVGNAQFACAAVVSNKIPMNYQYSNTVLMGKIR